MKILLVEDDYLDAMNVQRAFQKLKLRHELTVCRNGRDAVDFLIENKETHQENPGIILLDLNMPKMNGIEFLRELRKNEDFNLTKIFIMTTSDDELDRMEAQKYTITGYIIKPLSFDRFDNPQSSLDSFNLLCELIKE
jgi:DNA-binding response OmpR family regulator